MGELVKTVERPFTNDVHQWHIYWKGLHQPWRTEPEIGPERQEELSQRRMIAPNIEEGIYPFKGMKLSRADIEWLLATLENGPVDWSDQSQRRRAGLDVRGADLQQVNLRDLPLARLLAGLTWNEWNEANTEQREAASALLQGANLHGANLEGARLRGVHLEDADLAYTYLEAAQLRHAYLARTNFQGAFLHGTDLYKAHLADKEGIGPHVADIHWRDTDLSVLHWDRVAILGDEREARRTGHLDAYERATRAYRQMAVVLQSHGLNEVAARYTYRAQVLQRKVFWKQHTISKWFGSMMLALLAGYGYRMWRTLAAYLLIVLLYAGIYYVIGQYAGPHLELLEAIHTSLTAFHGRGFTDPFAPNNPEHWITVFEGISGLLLESIFIAMLTQRFFGK